MDNQLNNNYNNYEELEIDLREYIKLLWRKKHWIIGLVIVAMLAAFIFTRATTEVQYQAKAEILLMPPRHTEVEVSQLSRSTYAEMTLSDHLLGRIIEEVDLRDDEDELLHPADIDDKFDLEIIEDDEVAEGTSYFFRMHVTGTDPEETTEIANTWAELYKDDTLEIRLDEVEEIYQVSEERFAETEKNLEEAEERLEELKEEARLERLSSKKDNYRESLQEAEAEVLRLEEELGLLETEQEQLSETIADMEDDGIWLEEFSEVLFAEAEGEKAQDLLQAQDTLAEANKEYRIDLLELQQEQKIEQVDHFREKVSLLEQKEQEGQREELLALEDDIHRQQIEIETLEQELDGMATEEGLWFGDRTLELEEADLADIDADLQQALDNYWQKRETLFNFWEQHDLVSLANEVDFKEDLLANRKDLQAELEEDLARAESDLEELTEVLEQEPEKYRLERSLSEDVFWDNIFSPEELEILTELVLEEEQINPVYETLRQERSQLEIKVNALPQQISHFAEEIDDLALHKENLRLELSKLEEEEADIKEDLSFYESVLSDWQDDFRDLQLDKVQAERELRGYEVEMDLLEEYENPRLSQQQDYYQNIIAEYEDEANELAYEINQYQDKIALLEQDVDHYQELYDHQADNYRDLVKQYFDSGIEIDNLQAQKDYYESHLDYLNEEVDVIEEQVWRFERNIERVERDVSRYEESYDRLVSLVEDANLAMAEQTSDVRFVSEAVPPGRTIGRGTTLNMAIAAVLAGMLGVFGVFFQEFMKED